MQKSVEKLLKKKIIEGSIQDVLFEQCIFGNKELVKVCCHFLSSEWNWGFVVLKDGNFVPLVSWI